MKDKLSKVVSFVMSFCILTSVLTVFAGDVEEVAELQASRYQLKTERAVLLDNEIEAIKVSGSIAATKAVGIVAVYNEAGQIKQVETTISTKVTSEGVYELKNSISVNDSDSYKIFIWDGLDTMKPLAEVYERPKYGYSVETLSGMAGFETMTVAEDGYIYYDTDDVIYRYDIECGTITEYFNPSGMEYLDGNSIRRDYIIDALLYNNYSNKLYMFGHYSTKDYANNDYNYGIYEVEQNKESLIFYANGDTRNYPTHYNHICMLDEDTAYVKFYGMHCSYLNLSDGTTKESNVYNGSYYPMVFYNDDEIYLFNTTDGLYFVGASAASSKTLIKKPVNNATNASMHLINAKGFTVYNEFPYYMGNDSGTVWMMDMNGIISKYIDKSEVYQYGDNIVDAKYLNTDNVDYFTMDYNALPIWYDTNAGTVKRYVKN